MGHSFSFPDDDSETNKSSSLSLEEAATVVEGGETHPLDDRIKALITKRGAKTSSDPDFSLNDLITPGAIESPIGGAEQKLFPDKPERSVEFLQEQADFKKREKQFRNEKIDQLFNIVEIATLAIPGGFALKAAGFIGRGLLTASKAYKATKTLKNAKSVFRASQSFAKATRSAEKFAKASPKTAEAIRSVGLITEDSFLMGGLTLSKEIFKGNYSESLQEASDVGLNNEKAGLLLLGTFKTIAGGINLLKSVPTLLGKGVKRVLGKTDTGRVIAKELNKVPDRANDALVEMISDLSLPDPMKAGKFTNFERQAREIGNRLRDNLDREIKGLQGEQELLLDKLKSSTEVFDLETPLKAFKRDIDSTFTKEGVTELLDNEKTIFNNMYMDMKKVITRKGKPIEVEREVASSLLGPDGNAIKKVIKEFTPGPDETRKVTVENAKVYLTKFNNLNPFTAQKRAEGKVAQSINEPLSGAARKIISKMVKRLAPIKDDVAKRLSIEPSKIGGGSFRSPDLEIKRRTLAQVNEELSELSKVQKKIKNITEKKDFSNFSNIYREGNLDLEDNLKRLDSFLPKDKRVYNDIKSLAIRKEFAPFFPKGIGNNVAIFTLGSVISAVISDGISSAVGFTFGAAGTGALALSSPRIHSKILRLGERSGLDRVLGQAPGLIQTAGRRFGTRQLADRLGEQ